MKAAAPRPAGRIGPAARIVVTAAVAPVRNATARVSVMRRLGSRIMRVTAPAAVMMMITAAKYAPEHGARDAEELRRRRLRLRDDGEWQSKKRDQQSATGSPARLLRRH